MSEGNETATKPAADDSMPAISAEEFQDPQAIAQSEAFEPMDPAKLDAAQYDYEDVIPSADLPVPSEKTGEATPPAQPSEQLPETGTTEPVATEPETAEEVPPAKTSPLDENLVTIARRAGMTQEQIDTYPTTEALHTTLRFVADQRQQAEAAQAKPATSESEVPEEELQALKLELGLPTEGEEAWDPRLVEAVEGELNKLSSHMHERVQAIERGVHAERQMRMEQEAREVAAEVDKFFDSLPAEWEDTFGKGPGDQLDPNGLLMRNRKALCQEGAGRSPRTNNGRYPSIPELLLPSLRITFPDKCTQIDRAKLIADLGLKQTQAVAAPTQRKAPPKSTNAEIDEYLDEWALSKGYQPAPVATSEGF